VYGLNDPKSDNYVADLNERIRVAAEMQTVAANLFIAAAELVTELEKKR
jgi:hypothetical protein